MHETQGHADEVPADSAERRLAIKWGFRLVLVVLLVVGVIRTVEQAGRGQLGEASSAFALCVVFGGVLAMTVTSGGPRWRAGALVCAAVAVLCAVQAWPLLVDPAGQVDAESFVAGRSRIDSAVEAVVLGGTWLVTSGLALLGAWFAWRGARRARHGSA